MFKLPFLVYHGKKHVIRMHNTIHLYKELLPGFFITSADILLLRPHPSQA